MVSHHDGHAVRPHGLRHGGASAELAGALRRALPRPRDAPGRNDPAAGARPPRRRRRAVERGALRRAALVPEPLGGRRRHRRGRSTSPRGPTRTPWSSSPRGLPWACPPRRWPSPRSPSARPAERSATPTCRSTSRRPSPVATPDPGQRPAHDPPARARSRRGPRPLARAQRGDVVRRRARGAAESPRRRRPRGRLRDPPPSLQRPCTAPSAEGGCACTTATPRAAGGARFGAMGLALLALGLRRRAARGRARCYP